MRDFFNGLKLRALLQATPLLVRRAAGRSPRLCQLLGERSFVMQIATQCGSGGHLTLRDGQLTFRPGAHTSPDFAQTWISAGEAFRTLASRDETELLRALEDGRCRLKGNFLVALWFNEAIKLAREIGWRFPSQHGDVHPGRL